MGVWTVLSLFCIAGLICYVTNFVTDGYISAIIRAFIVWRRER